MLRELNTSQSDFVDGLLNCSVSPNLIHESIDHRQHCYRSLSYTYRHLHHVKMSGEDTGTWKSIGDKIGEMQIVSVDISFAHCERLERRLKATGQRHDLRVFDETLQYAMRGATNCHRDLYSGLVHVFGAFQGCARTRNIAIRDLHECLAKCQIFGTRWIASCKTDVPDVACQAFIILLRIVVRPKLDRH
ncbi:hypothetical protein XI06_27215 [Bradyrhizobium sp. CCBAU 11434]|nr:hypothetical protein [Bradyrhizobium sp. CCBAU 11434]